MRYFNTFLAILLTLSNCATTKTAQATPHKPEPIEALLVGYVNDSMAAGLAADFMLMTPQTPFVLLHVNSVGGEVRAGYLIAKMIEEAPVPVVCLVDMEASSMAFYILQSCDVRMMTKRSHLMMHQPYTSLPEDIDPAEKRRIENDMRVIRYGFAEHISKRLGITAEEYLAILEAERDWAFTWKDALKWNAVDLVVEDAKIGRKIVFDSLLSAPGSDEKAPQEEKVE